MSDQVFAALGDPMRRHLYRQLAQDGPLTATALAADLEISRQAVAKHLGVLSNAGMASATRIGRETQYEASLAPLGDVQRWITSVEGEWTLRLGALSQTLKPKG